MKFCIRITHNHWLTNDFFSRSQSLCFLLFFCFFLVLNSELTVVQFPQLGMSLSSKPNENQVNISVVCYASVWYPIVHLSDRLSWTFLTSMNFTIDECLVSPWFSPLLLFEKNVNLSVRMKSNYMMYFHYWNFILGARQSRSQQSSHFAFHLLYIVLFFCREFFCFFFNKGNNICVSNTRCTNEWHQREVFQRRNGTVYSPVQRFLFSTIQDPLWCPFTFSLTTFLNRSDQKDLQLCMEERRS